MLYGGYPHEYDPKRHGPYDPGRYYGKPDTPFGQVKLRDLPAWLARRRKSPFAVTAAVSRAWWRWQHKYMQPKRAGPAGLFQIIAGLSLFFYVINFGRIRQERNYKHH